MTPLRQTGSRPRFPGAGRWLAVLVLAALLAVALGMRLSGLLERGIWLDETVSLQVAAQPPGEIARGQVFDNHTPPLYYLLLHLWFQVVPEGLFTLRLLSVLLDLGVLVLLVATVARAFGRRRAVAVGAAYAIAPFAVRLAQEGRMYPLLVLLVVACFALALEVDRHRHRRWTAAALVPVAAAALYTHYYAALSLLALHAAMAWRLRGDRRAALRWWGAMAGAGLLFVPWLPVVVELLDSGGQFFRAFGVAVVPYAFLRFAVGFSLLPTTVEGKMDLAAAVVEALPLLLAVGLGVGLVVLLGGMEAWRRGLAGRLAVVLAAAPPLLALAVSAAVPSLDERYLAVSFPFFLVLAVQGLGARELGRGRPEARSMGGGGAARRLAWLARGMAVALFLLGAAAQLADPDAGTTAWRTAAETLENLAPEGRPEGRPEGKVVRVRPGYYAPVLRRNLEDEGWQVLREDPAAGHRRGGGKGREGRRAGRASRDDAPRSAEAGWLVEVVFLTRHQPPPDPPGGEYREVRLLPEGNGLRLSRWVSRRSSVTRPPAGGGADPAGAAVPGEAAGEPAIAPPP